VLAVVGGAVVAFYACIGFEDAVNVAEEARDPVRSMPRAVLGGLGIASLVYVAVSFTAALVVEPLTLASSSGALLEVVAAGPLPIPPRFFSAIALFAISNTALINMIMASRLTYGMARDGILPSVFARTHPTRRTPWVAILVTTLIGVVLVTTGDLGDLANTTVMLLLAVFAIVNVAVLVLRKDPIDHRHFSTPTVVPILGSVSCLALLTQQDPDTYLRGGALLLVGLALWAINALASRRLRAAGE
jgi:amino acid transporter